MPSLSIGILLSVASGTRQGSKTDIVKELNGGFKGFTCEDNAAMKKKRKSKKNLFSCGECETDENGLCRPMDGKNSIWNFIKGKGKDCKKYCHSKWYDRESNIRIIQESVENLDELDSSLEEHTILCYDSEKQIVEAISHGEKPCEDTDSKTGYMIKVIPKYEEDGVLDIVEAYPISNPEFRAASLEADTEDENHKRTNHLTIKEVETETDYRGQRLASLLVVVAMKAFKSKRQDDVQLDNASLSYWIKQGNVKKENYRYPGGNDKKCRAFFAGTKAYLTASRVAGFRLFKTLYSSKYEPIVDGLAKIEQEIKKCEGDLNYDTKKILEQWDGETIFRSNPNASHVADKRMFSAPSNAAHTYPKDKFYEKERNIQAIQESILALNLQRGKEQEHTILCYDWDKQIVAEAGYEDSPCEGFPNSSYMIKVKTDKVEGFYPDIKAYTLNESEYASNLITEIKRDERKINRRNLKIRSIVTLPSQKGKPTHQGKRLAILLLIVSMKAFKHFHDGDVELHNMSMHFWMNTHKREHESDGPGGDIKKCQSFFSGTKAYLTASRAAGFRFFEIKDEVKPIDSGLNRIEEEIKACGRDEKYGYRKKMEEWGHSMNFSSTLDDEW